MYYLQVLVASSRFHKDEPLTYSSNQKLIPGSLVVVPLLAGQAQGIVVESTVRPSFKVKPILRVSLEKPLPAASLELLRWLVEYYPSGLGQIVSQFMPSGLLQKPRLKAPGDQGNRTLAVLPSLTSDQRMTVKKVLDLAEGSSTLIHGDTGTGKTRIYMELSRQALDSKRDVLILTPEISLSPQLAREFESAFQGQIIVLHSALTPGERRDAWTRVLYAETPVVVIGPRSALFAPFNHLGLVVVDEAHEPAYKQEQAPYYDGRRVASKLASLHGARLVYGTATPSVTDYYMAEAKGAQVIRLTRLATSEKLSEPNITLVQARERSLFTRHPRLSDALIEGVEAALARREQALIFLNRRGTARLVLCQNCGWQALCPNCDLPLTYHGDHHDLRCHTCGHSQKTPSDCPVCRSTDILFRSLGTKSLVEAIEKLFPEARVQRFDTDNSKTERFEQHFTAVSRGEVDILIGTQLLVKGLDLPHLSFVGVVAADTSLSFPDYTASERTYQLLTQVVGRIARGHRAGSAVIQTYQPESPAIQAVISKDWTRFYKAELIERRQFVFPPFCHLLKLTCSRKTVKGAQRAAEDLAAELRASGRRIQVIGPSPSFYEKGAGQYRWQLVVKSKKRSELVNIIQELPSNWVADIDPSNLL